MVWFELLICAATILIAGCQLSKYGDEIADRTGLGKTWIGLILLATVTSLPELISGVSAVTLNNLPDVAVGGVIGSCLFNLVILALLDMGAGDKPLSSKIHHSHVITAGFGIVLLASFCVAKGWSRGQIGWFDPFSILYIVIYLLAMRTIFQFETRRSLEATSQETKAALKEGSLLKPALMFSLFSVFIVLASLWLPGVAERIGAATGLSNTFIGSSLVAITTSLPEVVVSLSAARLGAFDMAVGNVLGSNLFNMAILGIDDLAYLKGPLLLSASMQHSLSALVAIVTTAIAVISVTFRAEKKAFAIHWDSMAILGCYVVTTYWLFATK